MCDQKVAYALISSPFLAAIGHLLPGLSIMSNFFVTVVSMTDGTKFYIGDTFLLDQRFR